MKLSRIAFCAALLLAAAASIAQSKHGDIIANIPFPFVAAGQTFPAGRYIVSPLNEYSLRIQGRKNEGTFVPIHTARRSENDNSCKMVFHHYQDMYFLAEVWTAGPTGRALYPSHAERELAAKRVQKEDMIVAAE